LAIYKDYNIAAHYSLAHSESWESATDSSVAIFSIKKIATDYSAAILINYLIANEL